MGNSAALLSSRFVEALRFAFELHKLQTRKTNKVPYFAHLMSVAALVLEAGGDEDQAIAALLHDAVEDQGGRKTLLEIQRRFGNHVAEMVDGCTDSYTYPKDPWRKRKEKYIQRLETVSPEARLVSLADKLHNTRSILRDLSIDGDTTWGKFKGGKEGTIWYYHTLVKIFKRMDNNFLVDELYQVVSQIERISNNR